MLTNVKITCTHAMQMRNALTLTEILHVLAMKDTVAMETIVQVSSHQTTSLPQCRLLVAVLLCIEVENMA